VPQAQVYGVFDSDLGYTTDGQPLRTTTELRAWLERFHGDGFVFKPVEGAFGDDVLVFQQRDAAEPGIFLTIEGHRYDAERLAAVARQGSLRQDRSGRQLQPYLLQERLRPHPEIQALLGGPTVCCARIVTFIDLQGRPRLFAAAFKLQAGAVSADNFSLGSATCFVDLETGALGRGRAKDNLADITLVPGTGRGFVGFRLPDWEEVKAVALQAAATFPWARAVGWDIALSDRGPVLLEGNDRWAPGLIQLPADHGLLAGDFKALCDAMAERDT
jgi:hypothetical protein